MKFISLIFLLAVTLFGENLMQLSVYNGSQNISGWVWSIKLDGVRGFWDGKKLRSKQNLPYSPPNSWLKDFPPFALDGEIYSKKGEFEKISSITAAANSSKAWDELNLHVFDVPDAKGDLFERLAVLQNWLNSHPNAKIRIIPQHKITKNPYKILNEQVKNGEEGIVLRDPKAPYLGGRQRTILKLKPNFDSECEVKKIIRHADKQAKSIECAWFGSDDIGARFDEAVIFRLSLQGKNKLNPPKIGEFVKFNYKGLTKNNKPKFASLAR